MKRSLSVLMLVLGILIAGFALHEVMPPSHTSALTSTPSTSAMAIARPVTPSLLQRLVQDVQPVVTRAVVQRLSAPSVRIQPQTSSNPTSFLDTVTEQVVEQVATRQTPSAPSLTNATGAVVGFVERAIENTRTEDATPDAAGVPANAPAPDSRWLVGLNVQGGVVATTGHATGYVAGVQWLKRGTDNTPGHLRYALASPVFFGAPNVKELGLLPVSVNVATLVPHQPFTNLWVSPYVSLDWSTISPQGATLKRVGVALTATF